MRLRPSWLWLFLLVVPSGPVQGQNFYHLPQVADGAGIRTTFVFFNHTAQAVSVEMRLYADDGNPMPMPIPGLGSSGYYTFTIQSRDTLFYQSQGEGPVMVGSGTVQCSAKIGVSAIFTLYGGGNILTEAGVGASSPLTQCAIAVDTARGLNTGLAIQNLSSSDSPNQLSFTLYDEAGHPGPSVAGRSLLRNGHTAFFVGGPEGLFPGLTEFRGQLVVSAQAKIAALTLRQGPGGAPLTTLPVAPTTSANRRFYLPHFANGRNMAAGLACATTFIMFNLGGESGSVSLALTDAGGYPFPVRANGFEGSNFAFDLPAHGVVFLETEASGLLLDGAARVTSSVPIGVCAVFALLDKHDKVLTEAGVGDSAPLTVFALPADRVASFNTGVAFFNKDNASAVTINASFVDQSAGHHVVHSAPIVLQALQHRALFVTELFQGLDAMRGQVVVTSSAPISAVVLRQGPGVQPLTTLPVVDGGAF